MAPTSKEAVVSSPLDINDPELGEKVDLDTVFEKAGLNGGVDLSKSLLPSQSASKEVVPFTGKTETALVIEKSDVARKRQTVAKALGDLVSGKRKAGRPEAKQEPISEKAPEPAPAPKAERRPSRPRAVDSSSHAKDIHSGVSTMPARSGERPPRPRPAPKAPEKQPAGRHIDVREIEDESSVKITHDRTSYKEFKEKQEELWGANDKLDAKDVPDGELTWEQYLAMRPKAEADDVMHYGGKVRSAETGQFASKAKYEARREDISADDHYDKINLKRDIEDAHEEALKENKTFDAKMSETVKANTEGELLVAKDPRLQAVLGLGRELLELQSKKASPNKYEKKIKSEFETKELMFNELMRLYKLDGADARALGYIENVTEQLRDFDKAPVKPEVTYNGAQVTVTGMEETAGGTKVYDITLEDGTTRKAVAADLEFSRDYTAPEAEKGNVVERIKEWFSKERKSIQQYGGMAWFSAKFDRIKRGLNDRTLNYGVEDSMSAEQKDKLRRRNRVIAIAAGAALAGAAIFAISQGLSHGSDVSATDLPTDLGSGTGGAAGTELGSEAAAVGTGTSGVENLPLLSDVPDTSGVETAPPPDTSSGIETVPTPLPGEFFNVPSGQGGEALFTNLGIDPSKWYANEDTLLAQFPDDFYRMGDGHVGIAHSGWLSQGAQDFINTLR